MTKNIKIYVTVEIPQLYEIISAQSVYTILNEYIGTIRNKVNFDVIGDWNLSFNILLQKTDKMSIAKRLSIYPSDKEYAIYMSIPIPDDTQIFYGIFSVREAFFKNVNEKYSYVQGVKHNAHIPTTKKASKSIKIQVVTIKKSQKAGKTKCTKSYIYMHKMPQKAATFGTNICIIYQRCK